TTHLAQAATLPGDLVGGHAGLEAALLVQRLAHAAVEQDEGVMVAAVASEVAFRVAQAGQDRRVLDALREVQLVRDAEAQQVGVEVKVGLHVYHVEAEVPQAAYLERLLEQDAADVELRAGRGLRYHAVPPSADASPARGRRAFASGV